MQQAFQHWVIHPTSDYFVPQTSTALCFVTNDHLWLDWKFFVEYYTLGFIQNQQQITTSLYVNIVLYLGIYKCGSQYYLIRGTSTMKYPVKGSYSRPNGQRQQYPVRA